MDLRHIWRRSSTQREPAAIGSIVAIIGLAAVAYAVFALAGMALY